MVTNIRMWAEQNGRYSDLAVAEDYVRAKAPASVIPGLLAIVSLDREADTAADPLVR